METGKQILIIDDDPRNIFALRLVLKSKGFDCLSALSAAEGFKILEENNNIGVILMDMMMPDMDGYEAIGRLHTDQTTAGIPVIAVTAQAMLGDRERCLRSGASEYISKPVDVDILLTMLNRYL